MEDYIFIPCECGDEAIQIQTDTTECVDKDNNKVSLLDFYFAIFYFGKQKHALRLKDKLRYCWRIFSKGSPYGDQIILNEQEATKLVNFIQNKIGQKNIEGFTSNNSNEVKVSYKEEEKNK